MRRNTLFSIVIVGIFLVMCSCNEAMKKNRLSHASSPYLLEHADNPVDWYEWGDEALQRAKKENKPLLISIGYASCHWCHVMERESFMDTAVARLMNENFINIKVDREERPDLDNIYMNACQLITGGDGGWPLNAFALPDGKPFFAGTYYSNNSWVKLLKEITQAYKEKKDIVVRQAEELTKGIGEEELSFLKADTTAKTYGQAAYQNLFDSIYNKIDTVNGGLQGSPKFPMPALQEFLLQYHYLTGNKEALDAATLTLTKMALGGIYDHAGGGFARYATDITWKVPHFEKMLYDNGQLVSLYAHAYQVTKDEFFKNVLEETIAFVERDLTSSEGGFYSSLNADTEDEEGGFYVWSNEEFAKITRGAQESNLAEYFNVSAQGNWGKNKNILYASETPASFAIEKKEVPAEFMTLLRDTKKKLLTERSKRTKPSTDDKVLTSWNAIMLKGYADAYGATGESSYLTKALLNAGFIEKNMLGKDGHLFRNYKDGRASVDGFLDDYAWLARAFTRLYQVSFDKHWLTLALEVTKYAMANFYDNKSGMFYYTPASSSSLVVRKMEISDNVIPSSNAVMAMVLYELGTYFDKEDFLAKSTGMFNQVAGKMKGLTSYYAQWACLGGVFSFGTYEVAIMGKDADKKNLEIQLNYLPTCLFMGDKDKENLPLLEGKLPAEKTLIYVCTNKICKLPVENVDLALRQINGEHGKSEQKP